VRGDERVIRSCGWEKHEKGDCYSTVLEEYNTYVCACYEEGCNSASMLVQLFHSSFNGTGARYLITAVI
jgi:hypothetical protein